MANEVEGHGLVRAPQAMHQIGEVAEAVGLSLRTIRYYGEVGLVEPSGRSTGGFRLYTADDMDRLRLLKDMKPLDFTLEDMRELLGVRDELEGGVADDERRNALLERLAMYTAAAQERCARLRDQLTIAESFSGKLRHEVARHRRPEEDQ